MKKLEKYVYLFVMFFGFALLSGCQQAEVLPAEPAYELTTVQPQNQFTIIIAETAMSINGKVINRYQYTDNQDKLYLAGLPLVMRSGEQVTLEVSNQSDETTNIHWHGLHVPNDQDGPEIMIDPGETYTYTYQVPEPGTYWYHAHQRPVRDQVDGGMYGPLIILAPEDEAYDKDFVFMLDDWTTKWNRGQMEQIGDVDTINGEPLEQFEPVSLVSGEMHKWRLVNASTAKTQQLQFPFPVRVTHTDGQRLATPEVIEQLTIYPGERYDVEVQYQNLESQLFSQDNQQNSKLQIPINFTGGSQQATSSPIESQPITPITREDVEREPDFELILTMAMGRGMMNTTHHWQINGEVFPNTPMLSLETGQTYKIRYENTGMHQMVHPMHIHGTHFRVLSINDQPVEQELWKDTIGVPAGGSVEILVNFTNPGMWMLHCHILDHEDGGMMMMLDVS